ncbi:AbrB/MazE/SpoVT family DNA-binding domain-containing protein [Acidobacteria bacterium AH-259-D05]|nr:AbrB/MazE/SpoVT family DNA-binding domain-containing protein [Acidobacteria bacterium AH-259-D05]
MKVTAKGQVTLPKKLRQRYGITPATEVEFIERGGEIILVKKATVGPLARFRGIAKSKDVPERTDDLLTRLRDGADR